MKRLLLSAVCALCGAGVLWGNNLIEDINAVPPEEHSPAFKKAANDKFGTQWILNAALGYWQTNNAAPHTNMKNNDLVVVGLVRQRVIDTPGQGGTTWLRCEFGGTWGLDHATNTRPAFVNGYGGAKLVHGDIFGSSDCYILELSVEQYFLDKRLCVQAGVIDFTNYFDLTRYTNSTFRFFTNGSFKFSSIIPTGYNGNPAVLVQSQVSNRDFVQLGLARLTADLGDDPFMDRDNESYTLIGEWAHHVDDALTLHVLPLIKQLDTPQGTHRAPGITGTIDYKMSDKVGFFTRLGAMATDEVGNSADFSVGTNLHITPGRPQDYLGIAYGVLKPNALADHNREQKVEIMYRFILNDFWSIVPHAQFIHDPGYRKVSDEQLFGVHLLLRFTAGSRLPHRADIGGGATLAEAGQVAALQQGFEGAFDGDEGNIGALLRDVGFAQRFERRGKERSDTLGFGDTRAQGGLQALLQFAVGFGEDAEEVAHKGAVIPTVLMPAVRGALQSAVVPGLG